MQRLVEDARARGEIAEGVSDAALLSAIAVLMSGLAYQAAVQPDLAELRALFSAVDLLLEGKLFTTPGRRASHGALDDQMAKTPRAAVTPQQPQPARSDRRADPPSGRQPAGTRQPGRSRQSSDHRPTRSTLT
jgi:hypothetical protein